MSLSATFCADTTSPLARAWSMRLAMPGSDPRVRESPIITQQRLARVTDTLMRLEN